MLKNYKKPFIYAGLIHLGVFILLISSFSFESKVMPKIGQPSEPIQAITVNSTQVQAEITKIKLQEKAKQDAELNRQKYLKQLATQAKEQQKKATENLFQLKQQQKKLEQERLQQQKETQHQLDLIQKQHDLELQKLNTLQQERQLATHKEESDTQPSSEEKLLEEQIAAEQKQLLSLQDQQTLNELEKCKALILNAIGQHWIMPPHFDPRLKTQLLIQLASNGAVLDIQLSNSSGDDVLDRSVMNAVWKASPLPVPSDATLFEHFKQFRLTVRPEGFLVNSTPNTTTI